MTSRRPHSAGPYRGPPAASAGRAPGPPAAAAHRPAPLAAGGASPLRRTPARRPPSAGQRASARSTREHVTRRPGLPSFKQARSGFSGLPEISAALRTGGKPRRHSCGVSTCTTGTGLGGSPATRTGRPPGRCSRGCGDPGGRRRRSAAAMPGFPTLRRSAPGRGAGCTVTWWLAAVLSTDSYGNSRCTSGSCDSISSPMSAATTW